LVVFGTYLVICLFAIVFSDVPSAPTSVHVTALTGDSIALGWELPEDDGGCKVTGYVVEYRGETGKKKSWQPGGRTEERHKMLTGLSEGRAYLIRVAAENEVGRGPFVQLDKPVTPIGKIKKSTSCL
jgi:titin